MLRVSIDLSIVIFRLIAGCILPRSAKVPGNAIVTIQSDKTDKHCHVTPDLMLTANCHCNSQLQTSKQNLWGVQRGNTKWQLHN